MLPAERKTFLNDSTNEFDVGGRKSIQIFRLFQRNESLDFSLNVPQHHHSTSYHHNSYAMADQVSSIVFRLDSMALYLWRDSTRFFSALIK